MNDDSIIRAASWIREARRICILTGAGVSAESGIPTFRGLGGLWRGRDPLSLATPAAFAHDPLSVWEFYNWRRTLVRQSSPNPAHHALAELARRARRLTLVTQNVDRLHQSAGSVDVLELHGNLGEVICTGCRTVFDRWEVDLPPLPACEKCQGLLRPGVVWFGEPLPSATLERAEIASEDADVFLVIGTSALVQPAASLIGRSVHQGQRVIEVNLDETPVSSSVSLSLRGRAGEILPRIVAEAV